MSLRSQRIWWPVVCGVVLAACGAASAQTYEIAPTASFIRIGRAPLGSISPNDRQDTDSRFKNALAYGVRLTWTPWRYYGHELGYLQSNNTFQTTVRDDANPNGIVYSDKVRVQHVFYNFMMYMMPKGERWRPFIALGAQIHQYGRPDVPDFPSTRSRNYGANYGAGVKLKLFKNALLRIDVRDYIGGKPYDLDFRDPLKSGGILHNLEGSFGIGICF